MRSASTAGWRQNVEGYKGPLTVLQFKGGQSNPTYRLDTPGRSYVMRRKPFGKLLPSAHAVDREFRVIAALSQAGLSGRARLCALHRRQRDRLRLLHHVDGGGPRVLGSRRCRARRPMTRRKIFTSKIETLAHLHNFDPETDRAFRFRPARKLFRAPGRPLDQAVSRLRDPAHPGSREADRVAAAARCPSRSASRSCMATIASTT